jgi:uncharacterized lipoprotein YehR (DUF1307 family)
MKKITSLTVIFALVIGAVAVSCSNISEETKPCCDSTGVSVDTTYVLPVDSTATAVDTISK